MWGGVSTKRRLFSTSDVNARCNLDLNASANSEVIVRVSTILAGNLRSRPTRPIS